MPELAQYAVGQPVIRLQVLPFDLHIHGSRKSKVEDLRGHVGGQEVEGSARELKRQCFSQIADVIGRGMVFLVERNQYVGIGRAYGSRCVVHIIELAVWEADIVGNARHLLTGNGGASGAFDQRSRRGANVKDELTAIGVGEKVLTKPWHQRGSRKTDQQESRNKKKSFRYQRCQQPLVGMPKSFKPAVECLLRPRKGI